MAIEKFNRQELKFIITKDNYESIKPVIEQHMQLDNHNTGGKPYTLYNLYIDTIDSQLIRRSLDNPIYKEKLRIRSYHRLDSDQPVFLELKKRYRKITNKRRTKIPFEDALKLITTGVMPKLHNYMNAQVVSEFEATCSTQKYEPKVFITYDREAYTAITPDDDLRITFDTNVQARRFGQSKVNQLLSDDKLIMEVKTMFSMPLWLSELMAGQGIRRQSFSKYGTEYRLQLQQKLIKTVHA